MEFSSPVYHIKAVPVEKIIPNTYNPNTVAPPELKLLYDSIREDGYTMPIVCYYSQPDDAYIIVDGFHRYRVMLEHRDIYEREKGLLPVSVIDKPLAQRMASTIRHNRARGSHDVDLMSNIVRELHDLGRSDAWISRHLGMDKDEILRLKQITGLVSLFRETNFRQAWAPEDEEEKTSEAEAAAKTETAAEAAAASEWETEEAKRKSAAAAEQAAAAKTEAVAETEAVEAAERAAAAKTEAVAETEAAEAEEQAAAAKTEAVAETEAAERAAGNAASDSFTQ